MIFSFPLYFLDERKVFHMLHISMWVEGSGREVQEGGDIPMYVSLWPIHVDG